MFYSISSVFPILMLTHIWRPILILTTLRHCAKFGLLVIVWRCAAPKIWAFPVSTHFIRFTPWWLWLVQRVFPGVFIPSTQVTPCWPFLAHLVRYDRCVIPPPLFTAWLFGLRGCAALSWELSRPRLSVSNPAVCLVVALIWGTAEWLGAWVRIPPNFLERAVVSPSGVYRLILFNSQFLPLIYGFSPPEALSSAAGPDATFALEFWVPVYIASYGKASECFDGAFKCNSETQSYVQLIVYRIFII